MSQPQSDTPNPDSINTFILELDEDTDVSWRSLDPQQREQLERQQRRFRPNRLGAGCSIKPETLTKMRIAAERMGISEGDLLTEGFQLLLQAHRDKLGDLLDPEPPGDVAKPENSSPST